jgi:hypothetical protein
MDLSWLQYLNNLFAFLGLIAFLGVIFVLKKPAMPESRIAPITELPSNNGNGKIVTRDFVEARIGQHEIHCSQAEDIKKTLVRLEAKIDGLYELRSGR